MVCTSANSVIIPIAFIAGAALLVKCAVDKSSLSALVKQAASPGGSTPALTAQIQLLTSQVATLKKYGLVTLAVSAALVPIGCAFDLCWRGCLAAASL